MVHKIAPTHFIFKHKQKTALACRFIFYIAPYNTAVASAVDVISTLETVAY